MYFRKGKQSIKRVFFSTLFLGMTCHSFIVMQSIYFGTSLYMFFKQKPKKNGSEEASVDIETFIENEESLLYQLEGERTTCTHLH